MTAIRGRGKRRVCDTGFCILGATRRFSARRLTFAKKEFGMILIGVNAAEAANSILPFRAAAECVEERKNTKVGG